MGEEPKVFEELLRLARREHVCCECRRKILPGSAYFLSKGLWDNQWDEYKTCVPCSQLREMVLSEVGVYPEDVCYTDLGEWLKENDLLTPEQFAVWAGEGE